MTDVQRLRGAAASRWPEIISHLGGIDLQLLDGKHHPCPRCGGIDRFRLLDPKAGAVICNQCFKRGNGDGLAALRWLQGWDFPTTLRHVAHYLGLNGHSCDHHRNDDPIVAIAREKRVSTESLIAFGARTDQRGKLQVVRVPVYDHQGEPHSYFDLAPGHGKGWFRTGKGSSGMFFPHESGEVRLPQADEIWHVAEGVKDPAALHSLGYLAAGMPGAFMPARYARLFRGVRVVLVPDRDKAAEEGSRKTARCLYGVAASVRVVMLPAPFRESGGADVRDILALPDGEELLRQAIEDAQPWKPSDGPDADKAQLVTNAIKARSPDGEPVVIPLPMADVLTSTKSLTDDWPRRVGSSLFVHDDHGIAWTDSTADVFGYLHCRGRVRWHSVIGCVTKDEFVAELRRTATNYLSVETLPHEPPIARHYYACATPKPGDGSTLRELVKRFSPATPLDEDFITAAFVTALWGGADGTRPAFVITADAGRGTGKTSLAAMVGYISGGIIDLSANETAEVVKQRLLSPDGMTKRIALLDNVKSLRFSWAELESLITTPTISGKRMYTGEASRPNTLTWLMTLNGASLSTDLSQRSVIIKIAKPAYSATWAEDTRQYIDSHRQEIIGDIIGFLRSPRAELPKHSRWGAWERDILARLPEPIDAQKLITERQAAADVEIDEADLIDDYFARELSSLKYNPDTDRVFIPSAVVCRWWNRAANENKTATAVTRTMNQKVQEKTLRRITQNVCNTYGRGFVWVGADAGSSDILTDLEARIAERERPRW
jgi:hypothetical protein